MKPALPKSVQDHLGRELRTVLQEGQPSPAYLGDPGLPRAFDDALRRLALLGDGPDGRRARHEGLAAVEAALRETRIRAEEHGLNAVRTALRQTAAMPPRRG
jgi:hypothetical protein